MAAMGVLQGESNRKKGESEAEAKASQAKYAPWSQYALNKSTAADVERPDAVALGTKGALMGKYASDSMGKASAEPMLPAVTSTGTPQQSMAGGDMIQGMSTNGMSLEELQKQNKWNQIASMNNRMQG
jgi:hypothetical protein